MILAIAFSLSKREVWPPFSHCDPFFQLWPIFPSETNFFKSDPFYSFLVETPFSKYDPFFQVWRLLCKCDHFFKVWSIFFKVGPIVTSFTTFCNCDQFYEVSALLSISDPFFRVRTIFTSVALFSSVNHFSKFSKSLLECFLIDKSYL